MKISSTRRVSHFGCWRSALHRGSTGTHLISKTLLYNVHRLHSVPALGWSQRTTSTPISNCWYALFYTNKLIVSINFTAIPQHASKRYSFWATISCIIILGRKMLWIVPLAERVRHCLLGRRECLFPKGSTYWWHLEAHVEDIFSPSSRRCGESPEVTN